MAARVLILEDDPISSKIWRYSILSEDHYAQVSVFASLSGLLERYGGLDNLDDHFDFMIIDLFLSGDQTGWDLLLRFGQSISSRVIVSSSIESQSFQVHCQDNGFDFKFVGKPLNLVTCGRQIREILSANGNTGGKDRGDVSNLTKDNNLRSMVAPRSPVLLMTGGHSDLGLTVVDLLILASDYRIVVTAPPNELPALRSRFEGEERIFTLPLDLTVPNSISRVADTVLEKFGYVDTLLNLSDCLYRSAAEHMDDESELHQIQVNFLGPMSLIRSILPVMRENGGGKIIHVSPWSNTLSLPTLGSYSASRQAMLTACEALWFELKPHRIDVTICRPFKLSAVSDAPVRSTSKARMARNLNGPYARMYKNSFFARPWFFTKGVSRESHLAKEIVSIMGTKNPPLWKNHSLALGFLDWIYRIIPRSWLYKLMYVYLNLRIRQENSTFPSNRSRKGMLASGE